MLTRTTPSFVINYEQQDEFQLTDVLETDIYHTKDIKEGGNVVDVGANIGVFSLMCAIDRKCFVVAAEPDPRNFGVLCKNIFTNYRDRGDFHIRPVQVAVSYYAGLTSFRSRTDHSGGSHLDLYIPSNDPNVPGYFTVPQEKHSGVFTNVIVPCSTLENLFDAYGIGVCDFLKLDCEGAEYFIFNNNNAELFRNRVRKLAFECHADTDTMYVAFLRNLGYDVQDSSYIIGHVIYASNKENS